MAEFKEELEELKAFGGALYRRTKGNDSEYIFSVKNFDNFDEELIKEHFGGGNYFLRAYYIGDDGRRKQKTVEIGLISGAPIRAEIEDEGEEVNSAELIKKLDMIQENFAAQNQVLLAMAQKINQPIQSHDNNILLKIIEMQNKNQKENFEMFLKGLDMGRELNNNSDDDDNNDDDLKDILKNAVGGLMGGKQSDNSATAGGML